ncbi:unnamed protein product, partial [Didymodactylos carnosus]
MSLAYVAETLYEVVNESLSLPEVKGYLSNASKSDSTILTDLSSGTFCQESPLFKDPNSLKIILHYDDPGITNPLGSKDKSVCMFYWTLANLPSVEKHLVRQYGYATVLADFFDSINNLQENGITLTVENKQETYDGSLFMVCGDLLGMTQLQGFKSGFKNGLKPYFVCNTSRIEKADGGKKAALQKKFGIVSRSSFTKIHDFDILQQTTIDVMHILLEEIHRLKYCSLALLSMTIRTFPFPAGESAPSEKFEIKYAKDTVKFRLSASKTLTLTKYLPLILEQISLSEARMKQLMNGHVVKKVREVEFKSIPVHRTLDVNQSVYETNKAIMFGIVYNVGDFVLVNDRSFPSDPVF